MFARANSREKASIAKNYQTRAEPQKSSDQAEWELNGALYQNLSNDKVDWAKIAQQWIQMKETLPPGLVPSAPPPPNITKKYEEQGEAPMEVEKDEELHHSAIIAAAAEQVWSSTNWTTTYPPQAEWRNPAWESWQDPKVLEVLSAASSSSTTPTVWPTKIYNIEPIPKDVKKIPSLMDEEIKLDNSDEDTTQTIDVAKRKLLPAWIREGLEKMEREKVKNVEKERYMNEKQKMMEERRKMEHEILKEMESGKIRKSKFESDSDSDDEEEQQEEKTRSATPEVTKPYRSREEVILEIMMSVRKNLTEILLEVTNEEIRSIAKETLTKTRKKAPTAQALRKTALSSLTGGLGLGIYADSSDSDSESERDKEERRRDEDESDSDSDTDLILQETIRRRKAEFEKTAREIEEEIEEEEAREERRNRESEREHQLKMQETKKGKQESSDEENGSSSRSISHRDGETQPLNDKFYSLQKSGRSRDKKMSRFSDPNDTVRTTHITHVAILAKGAAETIPVVPAQAHLLQSSSSLKNNNASDSSDGRSSSSRHKRKKSKRHKKSHKSRRHDYDDDDYYDDDDRDSYRRSRSSESTASRRKRSRSSSRSQSSRSRRQRSKSRDRKYSSSSSHYKKRSRSRSRDHYRKRSRSRSRSSRHSRY